MSKLEQRTRHRVGVQRGGGLRALVQLVTVLGQEMMMRMGRRRMRLMMMMMMLMRRKRRRRRRGEEKRTTTTKELVHMSKEPKSTM